MFTALRKSIGIQQARFHFRKSREKVISFTTSFSAAHNALLVLPLNHLELPATLTVIDMLKKQFHEENITVVAADGDQAARRRLSHSRFIPLTLSETTFFYLPRKEVLDSVRRKQYDLAIDLNLDLVLPSAYICKASNARVRIGFVRKRADRFFNFQVQTDHTQGREIIYDRMAKCLQMF
jgi:ADP-heptose:LPS heptosyltransferase